LSEESKLKISKTLKGRPNGKKGIKTGHIPWNKGKPWSLDMREKLSNAHIGLPSMNKGRKATLETRTKLSIAKLGKPNTSRYKPVFCITNNTIYLSGKHAAEALMLQRSKICLVLKNKRNHTGGYVFTYI
jgi:hypothetical protein